MLKVSRLLGHSLVICCNDSQHNAGRMSGYVRMVYLPMSYLYGKKFVGPVTPVVLELRDELYKVPYDEIDWNKARTECAKVGMKYLLNYFS